MNARTDSARKMITEEVQVAGSELLTRVKDLMMEGRVRHIKVKSPSGETYFEVPLAVGVLGGAALTFASPFLAMAGALAGLVSNVKLEVVRDTGAADAMATAPANRGAPAARRTVKRATAPAKRIAAEVPARAAAKSARSAKAAARPASRSGKAAKAKPTRGKAKGR
jgi:hypothetical protein